jgi:hypothetical protein
MCKEWRKFKSDHREGKKTESEWRKQEMVGRRVRVDGKKFD